MRDATFTLSGLHSLGLNWEADDFIQFVADVGRNEDGALQIMYGIGGERELEEQTLDHLTGYEGAQPVRIGNGAHDQRQNDVYGAVLDSLYLHAKEYGHNSRAPVAGDRRPGRAGDRLLAPARPGHLGVARRAPALRLEQADVLGRARPRRPPRRPPRQGRARRRVAPGRQRDPRRDLERGVDERGVFTQHYDTEALDASLLLIPLVRFLPHDDERVRDTVLAIADELTENGLVLRYRTDETDDGLSGEEGTFLICSFWLVSALLEIGERKRGRQLCERLLSLASLARPLRRGARRRDRPPPRQLPPGLHPPRADQRGHARDPRRAAEPGR